MSPFKRARSPYWQVWPRVARYGRVGPYSTGTKDKELARAMEAMLKALPLRGYGDLLEMMPKKFTLADLYVADMQGKLDELRLEIVDRPLRHAIAEEQRLSNDDRVGVGLDHLLRLAPDVRVSWLRDAKNITRLLREREAEGVKRNTVRRGMMCAISAVVESNFGKKERASIFSDVSFPQANDERSVVLSPEQIQSLIEAAPDPLFAEFVRLAVASGLDVAPLCRIQPEHLDGSELEVFDTKTSARRRRIELSVPAQTALNRAMTMTGAKHGEPVFGYSYTMVRKRWHATRTKVGLESVRLKDLRSVFATYYLIAGGSPKDLQQILGHTAIKTTLRYVKRLPVRQKRAMEEASKRMGLVALRVEKTG